MSDVRKLAAEFWKELANARTADAYNAIVKKWYADDVTQNEAGEPETKGLEEVLKREAVFFDNYFDWDNFPEAPTLDIHGQYVDERGVVFTDHTARIALKGAGVSSKRQLTEQHFDIQSGKLKKEVFWYIKH